MRRNSVLFVVLRATALFFVGYITSHEISRKWDSNVWDDPVLKNYTTSVKIGRSLQAGTPHGLVANSTLANATFDKEESPEKSKKIFYLRVLLKILPIQAVAAAFSYYWHLTLEYYLPTRPRGVNVSQKKEKTAEEDELQEQEIVNRWIAEGKVERLTISWRKSLLKWTIDAIFGTICNATLKGALDIVVYGTPKPPITARNFIIFMCAMWITRLFRLSYVVSFIGFMKVPAPQRPVFEYGAQAAIDIFFISALKIIFPKVIKSQIVQNIIISLTEAQWRYIQSQGGAGPGRLLDEL